MAVFRGLKHIFNNALFALVLCFFTMTANSAWADYKVDFVCDGNKSTAGTISRYYEAGADVPTITSSYAVSVFDTYGEQCAMRGYDFANKWSCNGNIIDAGDTFVMPNNDVTCTTQWDPIVYTVGYYDSDCTTPLSNLSPTTYTVANGITFPTVSNGPTKIGYEFDGWNGKRSSGYTNARMEQGRFLGIQPMYADGYNVELCALWQPNRYKVQYQCGDGIVNNYSTGYYNYVEMDDTPVVLGTAPWGAKVYASSSGGAEYDSPYQFWNAADKCILPGKVFDKWNCVTTNGGTAIDVDANANKWQVAENVTCTAQWKDATNKFDVIYSPGAHGTGGRTVTDGVTVGENYTPLSATAANVMVGVGYDFIGWNTAPGDLGVSNRDVGVSYGPYTNNSNLTLYAQYMPRTYGVTYSCTGGEPVGTATGAVSGDTFSYGAGYVLNNGANCSLYGHTFNGWSCTNGLTGNSGTWNITTDSVCTAQWIAATSNVIYNPGAHGVGGKTVSNGVTFGDNYVPLSATDADITVNTGYNFIGWNTDSGDLGVSNRNVGISYGPYDGDGNLTLYAQYAPRSYNVAYRCSGAEPVGTATGSVTRDTFYYNAPYVLNNGDGCSLENYSFNGWSCTDDLAGHGIWQKDGNVICVAQWAKSQYKLKWFDEDCTTEMTDMTPKAVAIGQEFTILDPTTKPGYTFLGWRDPTLPDTTSVFPNRNSLITGNQQWLVDKDSEFCATWEPKEYYVWYDCDTASGPGWFTSGYDTATATYGQSFTFETSVGQCYNQGFDFNSWLCKTRTNGDLVDVVANSTKWQVADNVTCTAQWTKILCNPGTYLSNNNICESCPDGYNSTGKGTNGINSCFKEWSCPTLECPEHATCEYIGGASGVDYYPNDFEHCNISYTCDKGYRFNEQTKTCVSNTYNVLFDGNGKTGGSMESMQDLQYDVQYQLDKNKFVKTGHSFAGWCMGSHWNATNQTCNGTSTPDYIDEATIYNLSPNGNDVLLYAMWTKAVYSITYLDSDCRTEIAGLSPATYSMGDAVVLSTNPTKSGYTLLGWEYADNYTGENPITGWNDNGVYGDKTLCAVWGSNSHTLTYQSGNHGSGTKVVGVSFGENYVLLPLTDTTISADAGFKLAGWNCSNNPGTTKQPGDTIVIPDENVTCTAQWDAKNYNVDFYYDCDNPGTHSTKVATYNSTFEFDNVYTCTQNDYQFNGWLCDKGIGNKSSGDSMAWNVDGNVTCTAQWTSVSCNPGYKIQPNPFENLDYTLIPDGYYVKYLDSRFYFEPYGLQLTYFPQTDGEWTAKFTYGEVVGMASCNATDGVTINAMAMPDTSVTGSYCWCRANAFIPSGSTDMQQTDATSWVYAIDYTGSSCKQFCAGTCTQYLTRTDNTYTNNKYNNFRKALFTSRGPVCGIIEYNIDYVLNGGDFYTVQLDDNCNIASRSFTDKPTKYTVISPTITLPTALHKDRFVFAGWCTDPDLTDCSLSQTIPSGSTGNKKFYAKWTQTYCEDGQYFNENNQCETCPTNYTSHTDCWGSKVRGKSGCYTNWTCPEITCPEHAINCSYVGETSGVDYYGSETEHCQLRFDCDTGYILQNNTCVPRAYNINYYNLDNAVWPEDSNHPDTYTKDSGTVTIDNPVRPERTFNGWCEDSADCVAPIKPFEFDASGRSGDINLYAQWVMASCPAGQYLSNGICKICPAGTYSVAGASVCTPCKNGKTSSFDGASSCDTNCSNNSNVAKWKNTTWSEAGGVKNICKIDTCADGYVLDATNSTCIPNIYKIRYNCGEDAEGVYEDQNIAFNDSYVLNDGSLCSFSGHTFTQWNCDTDIENSGIYNVASDTNCTADWGNKRYKITYKCGQGSATGVPASLSLKYGDSYRLNNGSVCAFDGRDFNGWDCDTNIANSGTYLIAGNSVCTAKWKTKTYTITYVSNGGTEYSPTTYTVESDTIVLPIPLRNKYNFEGWYEQSNFKGNRITQVAHGSTGNKIFYAKWSKAPFECESGKWLHVGSDRACLSTTKPHPALAFKIDNQDYYLQMSDNPELKMNENADKKLRIYYNRQKYNVHDESVAD